MNTATRAEPEKLPFDLVHRRWPIQYGLSDSEATESTEAKKKVRDELVADLTAAISGAAKEPRRSAFVSDTDLHTGKSLRKLLNSSWMANWRHFRNTASQYEQRESRTAIQDYVFESQKPEHGFEEEHLRGAHEGLVNALSKYLATLTRVMVGSPGNTDMFVVSAKLQEWSEGYDEKYDAQVNQVTNAAEAVWAAWLSYVSELRRRYPEIPYRED
jgi:hypothetical protein